MILSTIDGIKYTSPPSTNTALSAKNNSYYYDQRNLLSSMVICFDVS